MAAEQLTDQEKLFRVRARRRLIGAVALVLLMLTILPMLLDDRSNQNMPAPEVAISIPSQNDGNFSSKIVPIAPSQQSPASSSPALPETQAKPESLPSSDQSPVAASSAATPPVAAEVKPVTEIKPVVEKPVAEKTVVEKPVEAKNGTVSVQVGVISEGENVKRVLNKIADLELKSYTENLNTPTGVKVRIRCGPYASKEEAEKSLEKLKTVGFKPILVTHK